MSFAKKEYEFLSEIGLGPRNLGGYVNGKWKATGPVISTLNPANNQVSACERLGVQVHRIIYVFKFPLWS